MSNDLLFEIGTEELPSGSVWPLAKALAKNLTDLLTRSDVQYGTVHPYATPRRLAVLIHDVQQAQPDQLISRRGPACQAEVNEIENPSKGLLGFAKSCGVGIDQLTTLKTDKGTWWAYETTKPGAPTETLLPEIIRDAIATLPLSKAMRWGQGEIEFARPVHWAVLLFGDAVVEAEVLGVQTGRDSFGHRFHHPESIEITTPRAYASLLKKAYVMADFQARRQLIVEQINTLAKKHHAAPVMPESLLNEVASIVEWPQALQAEFDDRFLDVPPEALIAAMQSHQKCFALRDTQGNLLPRFITVANIESQHPHQVIAGNEKVMRARLSDADFFYRQDQNQPLSEYQAATSRVIFQARLGSLQDKAIRISAIMTHLVQPLGLNHTQALRAAALSKCDLMTGMVGEFPELQGLMGYYYAVHDQEDEAVALALNEQYMPRFSADHLPKSPLGLALSLADRVDTLVGIFAIGEKPSGVKDPFKLRRHALAVMRMLITIPEKLNLSTLIHCAIQAYGQQLPKTGQVIHELIPFMLDRMQSYYQGQAIPQSVVQAVKARQNDWIYDADQRIHALSQFIQRPEAISLSAACKRVNHLLEKAKATDLSLEMNPSLLEEGAEIHLFEHLKATSDVINPLYLKGDYVEILNQLANLKNPVDTYFDQVMVMVEDQTIRHNRLALLTHLKEMLQGVADISVLQ